MSIEQVSGQGTGAAGDLATRLFLSSGPDFSSNLRLGQIIKGRVLRQYEGSRYLVSFSGEEKVVDSAVPLSTNDVIHGRVVGLGVRVELQRVAIERTRSDDVDALRNGLQNSFGSHDRMMMETLNRYQVTLADVDKAVLSRQVKASSDPQSMLLVGVLLSKIGLNQSPELLRAVARQLEMSAGGALRPADRDALPLDTQPATGRGLSRDDNELATRIAAMLDFKPVRQTVPEPDDADKESVLLNTQPENNGVVRQDTADSGSKQDDEFNLGRWLLNVQSDGTVSHRVGTVPFLLGDRLIEVEVAVFDQREGTTLRDGVRHRQLVFSLDLESLGHLEIVARVAGSRLRVTVRAENSEATETLAGYMGPLRGGLVASGWQVDELIYETGERQKSCCVAQSAVEHLICQDSLNRLM